MEYPSHPKGKGLPPKEKGENEEEIFHLGHNVFNYFNITSNRIYICGAFR